MLSRPPLASARSITTVGRRHWRSTAKQVTKSALVLAAALVSGSVALAFLPSGLMGTRWSFSRAAEACSRREESLVPRQAEPGSIAKSGAGKKLLVLGGNGFVGREVCKLAVERGYQVTSLSRRGENPDPASRALSEVKWVKGNAADEGVVRNLVADHDAVVHAIGLLFDVNSGLTNYNIVVSGSGSVPDSQSTYDTITRKTAFNLIDAVKSKFRLPFSPPTPVLFVSAAEAGWPEVSFGDQVEKVAPAWLKEYLAAKRAVEKEIASCPDAIRPVVFRPSLIWSWTKFDVLPVIPIFNLASAVGIPFVDKTVTVNTLSRAIIAGLEDNSVSGVQRFMQMEQLEQQLS